VIALYVMTFDVTQPLEPMTFRLDVADVGGPVRGAVVFDPLTGEERAPADAFAGQDGVTVTVSVTDHPRLLVLDL
jgi:hypothetical protein